MEHSSLVLSSLPSRPLKAGNSLGKVRPKFSYCSIQCFERSLLVFPFSFEDGPFLGGLHERSLRLPSALNSPNASQRLVAKNLWFLASAIFWTAFLLTISHKIMDLNFASAGS